MEQHVPLEPTPPPPPPTPPPIPPRSSTALSVFDEGLCTTENIQLLLPSTNCQTVIGIPSNYRDLNKNSQIPFFVDSVAAFAINSRGEIRILDVSWLEGMNVDTPETFFINDQLQERFLKILFVRFGQIVTEEVKSSLIRIQNTTTLITYWGQVNHQNIPHGWGVSTWPSDCRRYIGNLSNGIMESSNSWYRSLDGSVYVGPFENGNPHGEGVVYLTNGCHQTVEYCEGTIINRTSEVKTSEVYGVAVPWK